MSGEHNPVFSPTDIDRLDALRYLILAAQREGARLMAARLRQVELNTAQEEVLEVIRRHGPLTLAELGRLLVCEVASPSRLVDGLVRRGYVDRRRVVGDKRVVMLTLTPAGEQAVEATLRIGGSVRTSPNDSQPSKSSRRPAYWHDWSPTPPQESRSPRASPPYVPPAPPTDPRDADQDFPGSVS